jgi:glycosyltransferase involved in cell wall biosynthesis
LRSLLDRLRPDIVLASEAKAHLYASLAVRGRSIPIIWRQPAYPASRSLLDRLATVMPADRVIVASDYIAGAQGALWPKRRVAVVPPGIDTARYDPAVADGAGLREAHGVPRDAPFVGIVGRLQEWKGQDVFIRAAAEILSHHPDAYFAVVGGAEMGWERGDYPERLRALAASLGIADRVLLVGQVEDTAPWFAALDVAVNASDGEPFGLVILEAMAMGTVVVAADIGGPREIIDHGRTGFLVDRTPPAIARAVGDVLDDPELRRRVGAAARREVVQRFTSDRMGRDLAEVVRDVVASKDIRLGSASRPRVLLVMPVAVIGGAGEVGVNLVASATDGDYDIVTVVLAEGPLVHRLEETGTTVLRRPAGRLRSIPAFVSTVGDLRRVIREVRPDLVFSNEPKAHLYAGLASALERVPALYALHGFPSLVDPIQSPARLVPARAVVVPSVAVAQTAKRRLLGAPVRVIRPGIEVERYRPRQAPELREAHGIPRDAVLFGIVGRLQQWKGQHLFLEAAEQVARAVPDAWFAVVGGAEMGWERGRYPEELVEQAERLGIASRVVFTGPVDTSAEWFAAIDVAVSATDHEPLGLVILEAMASGCAAIAVASGGPREVIRSEEDGILVLERSSAALAGAMIRLGADRDLRSRLGERAARRADPEFRRELTAQQYGELFRDITRDRA